MFGGRLARLVIVFLCLIAFTCRSAWCETRTDVMAAAYKAMDEQDWEAALVNFGRAKSMDSRDPTCRQYLGGINRKLHRFREAECEFEALKQMDPKNPDWRYELAQTYVDQGKYLQALPMYQELMAMNPKDAGAYLGVGICFEGSGDISSAKDFYDRTIDMAPGSTSAKSAKGRLERLNSALSARQSSQFFPIDPELGQAGMGWWDLSKMPIHVYIDDANNAPGYREIMRNELFKAMETWTQASRGHISFIVDSRDPVNEAAWKQAFGDEPVLIKLGPSLSGVPADPVQSSLHVHWVEKLPFPPPNKGQALGLAWTSKFSDKGGTVIRKAHLWIATNRLADGTPMPSCITPATANLLESQDRMIQEVMIHELGHCLGLTHSPNPNDIMAGGIFGLNAVDLQESRQLSERDIKSLAQHYNNFQGNGLPCSVVVEKGEKDETDEKDEKAPHKTNDFALPDVNTPALGQGWTPSSRSLARSPGSSFSASSPSSSAPLPPAVVPAEIKDAVCDINSAHYSSCADRLNKFLQTNPHYVQAHYLLAVAYVKMRRYPEAAVQYKQVIRLAPASDIARLAQEGLKKLNL